jgi:hypothetical protein
VLPASEMLRPGHQSTSLIDLSLGPSLSINAFSVVNNPRLLINNSDNKIITEIRVIRIIVIAIGCYQSCYQDHYYIH